MPSETREEPPGLAGDLEETNRRRRALTDEILAAAGEEARKQLTAGDSALVLGKEDWHPGVVGLVASRLANDLNLPVVVLSYDSQGWARGSLRGPETIDILAVLHECSGLLRKYGGHRQAAGITLRVEAVTEFSDRFKEVVARRWPAMDPTPVMHIDLEGDPAELMREPVWHYLRLLEPFGAGNPEPLFCTGGRGLKLFQPKKVGAGSLRFQVIAGGEVYNGIGFGLASRLELVQESPVRLAYRICRNEFRGALSWQIRVDDIKEAT